MTFLVSSVIILFLAILEKLKLVMFILVDVGKKTSVFWLGWKIGLSYHWGRLESLRP